MTPDQNPPVDTAALAAQLRFNGWKDDLGGHGPYIWTRNDQDYYTLEQASEALAALAAAAETKALPRLEHPHMESLRAAKEQYAMLGDLDSVKRISWELEHLEKIRCRRGWYRGQPVIVTSVFNRNDDRLASFEFGGRVINVNEGSLDFSWDCKEHSETNVAPQAPEGSSPKAPADNLYLPWRQDPIATCDIQDCAGQDIGSMNMSSEAAYVVLAVNSHDTLIEAVTKAREALKLAIKEFAHEVPGSCWSTGPLNGTAEDDVCRGCLVIRAAKSALESPSLAQVLKGAQA